MFPIVFFNTGWMDSYAGIQHNHDPIIGGGAHNREQGWGGEIFNFKPYRGQYYGFVRTTHGGNIKLEKLGAAKSAIQLDNVTVVWTALRPKAEGGGTYVVGWYKNATVFRAERSRPKNSRHLWEGSPIGCYAVAELADVVLLPPDARLLPVPRSKPNSMGQSHVWYAETNQNFVQQVATYIANGGLLPLPPGGKGGKRRTQPDPLVRIAVEEQAVKTTWAYYQKLGYELESVETEKVGWDLTATNGKIALKLEVKGVSGPRIVAELTANEYKNLLLDTPNYRICVVTSALISPKLHVFAYSKRTKSWLSQEGLVLGIETVTSARVCTI